jgi:hypothetical protein
MLAGEALAGQHVILGPAHQIRELRMARLKRVDQPGPMLFRRGQRVLAEGGSERRGDDWIVLLADASKCVAHEVDAAALDGRTEHLCRGGLQPLMIVGDDQAGAAQSAIGQRTQKLVPEDFDFTWLDSDTQNLAASVQVDRHGHYGSDAHDPTATADLDVSRVKPEIGQLAFQRTVQECIDAFINLAAEPPGLSLRSASHSHRLDQIIEGARRQAPNIGLLNDSRYSILRHPARLKELGQVAALAQLRDLHVDPSCTRFPSSAPVSVAVVHTVAAAFLRRGAAELIDARRHEAVGDEPEHLGKQVAVRCL